MLISGWEQLLQFGFIAKAIRTWIRTRPKISKIWIQWKNEGTKVCGRSLESPWGLSGISGFEIPVCFSGHVFPVLSMSVWWLVNLAKFCFPYHDRLYRTYRWFLPNHTQIWIKRAQFSINTQIFGKRQNRRQCPVRKIVADPYLIESEKKSPWFT